jgi:hypothetical protein
MAKSKKNKNKAKLNLTVREEQRNKLEQMASLENRSLSYLGYHGVNFPSSILGRLFLLIRVMASPPHLSTAPIRPDCRETRVRKRFASLIAPTSRAASRSWYRS